MSRIRTVTEKIDSMIDELDNIEPDETDSKLVVAEAIIEDLKEIKELLTDKTVLFLEWNEEDVQAAARQQIAFLESVKEEEIKEYPLTKEQVVHVLEMVDRVYDCNYGVTWEDLIISLDCIDLPNITEARR